MRAHFGLPSVSAEEHAGVSANAKAPIQVQFEIPYFTVSGIQVRYLKIVEKSGYQALPWVRYITQNGDDYRYIFSMILPDRSLSHLPNSLRTAQEKGSAPTMHI